LGFRERFVYPDAPALTEARILPVNDALVD